MDALFQTYRSQFHASLTASVLTFDQEGIPSIADRANRTSATLAHGIVERIGNAHRAVKVAGQRAGHTFEQHVEVFLRAAFGKLAHLRPGNWVVLKVNARRRNVIADYEPYAHLNRLQEASLRDPQLAASLGNDYAIAPDIVILRHPEPDTVINAEQTLVDLAVARHASLREVNNPLPIVHASVSCKWTLRSDRAQNARSEALNLIRNRKGRCPHIVVVTAEPTPSRLSSLALGTGDLDCVYHFALPELMASAEAYGEDEVIALLRIMIDGKRLKDIADLPLDLAI